MLQALRPSLRLLALLLSRLGLALLRFGACGISLPERPLRGLPIGATSA